MTNAKASTSIVTPAVGDDPLAGNSAQPGSLSEGAGTAQAPPTPIVYGSPTPLPGFEGTPTPDPTRPNLFDDDRNYLYHTVSPGETLGQIALQYGSTVEELMSINALESADILDIGQQIVVPAEAQIVGPSIKLIPDSELIYGPGAIDFDVQAVSESLGGSLFEYEEELEGRTLSGPEIVQLVAHRHSLNPRLLLALLEYRSGWVAQTSAPDEQFPMGYVREGYEGLYQQLSWAANLVNLGYYGRSEGGLESFNVGEQSQVSFARDINDGTAGLQLFLAAHPETTYEQWLEETGPSGFLATYSELFGSPFAYTVDPFWPPVEAEAALLLPWPEGETWYFTGGPHGGWAGGSAWAALDFAPNHEQLGCYESDSWITAMADGLVVRSDFGAVVVDLDGDGYPGTGWVHTYMHLATHERVAAGSFVRQGDPLGHPSCEGGYSNGTHLHLARTYNGRWVSADGERPFVMSGWMSQGLEREYDGLLVRSDDVKEACECREESNAITAD
jgi:murein DD-endopeptidase MepM/ murein hydrolase activator NlpD